VPETVIGVTAAEDARPVSYLRRIRERGGRPVLIRPYRNPHTSFEGLDGLLLTGGADVWPGHYGQEYDKTKGLHCDYPLDRLEMDLAVRALAADIPVLGVCRGFQLLNVVFRGTLIMDLPPALGKHRGRSDDHGVRHVVDMLPGTLLARETGVSGAVKVNSIHHQGLTDMDLAKGLRASAYDRHGLVEALESPGHRWVLGVQWHPERIWEVPPQVTGIFDAFINAARRD
jgi:putative glutamine amidotransferase